MKFILKLILLQFSYNFIMVSFALWSEGLVIIFSVTFVPLYLSLIFSATMASTPTPEGSPVPSHTASIFQANGASQTSSFVTGPKLSIKLDDKNFLIWNQQVEGVVATHKLHRLLVNPKIPKKVRFTGRSGDQQGFRCVWSMVCSRSGVIHLVAVHALRFGAPWCC